MLQAKIDDRIADGALLAITERTLDEIPPLWPLASSVAVNPFLGQIDQPLELVSATLARVAGVRPTMPRAWFAERFADGRLTDADLLAAINQSPDSGVDLKALTAALAVEREPPSALQTVAGLAAAATGTDWPGIIDDRIGAWASAFFDEGQAMWPLPRARGAYASWREQAQHDLTPEIHGLTGFARFVADLPADATAAFFLATERLGVSEAGVGLYSHRLLVTLGGWGQLARQRRFEADLHGTTSAVQFELLVIRLLWEAALLGRFAENIGAAWADAFRDFEQSVAPDRADMIDSLLQMAAELASQRALQAVLAGAPAVTATALAWQAAFCIDVRSERFRRALEAVDPGVQTLGFAGFFGLGTAHRRFASDVVEQRLPVLLTAGVTSSTGGPADQGRDRAARIAARSHRAWGRFKLAAVSSFAFVEAAGPLYIMKLARDALGLSRRHVPNEPAPAFDPPLPFEQRLATAEAVLRAMSLTRDFAPLVLLVGHGAGVTNNPHASALHCGACGGYSGEVNARLLAGLLNEAAVRQGLAARGIAIPGSTRFFGALHDTTSDEVTIYGDGDIVEAREMLAVAGRTARGERLVTLARANDQTDVAKRGADWAEVRPEWGLAGCQAFIAAPRERTAGRNLAGRAFLHDYDWARDDGFATLELILTAPVVVASWISLQYYGSTVAPALFGAGNKLLHNVVGGFGVVEGNGGLLRGGLPWQSVHDGLGFVHDPVRLAVCIEAPRDAIRAVLARHDQVRALFDHHWLHLFAMDEQGALSWRYAGDGTWHANRSLPSVPTLARAPE